MATRKVNHNSRISSKKSTSISKVGFRDIIEFKYGAKDIYDNTPMVFVLDNSFALVPSLVETVIVGRRV